MSHPQVPLMQYPMPVMPMEPDSLRNLMVNYIPTTIDETQLRQLFELYGPIESIKIVSDRETHQSRGYGFVKYRSGWSAVHAIQYLNGYPLMNKRLKVAYANAPDAQKAIAAGELTSGMGYSMGMPMAMGYAPYAGYSPSDMNYVQQQQLQVLQYQHYLAVQQQQQQQQQQQSNQSSGVMTPPGVSASSNVAPPNVALPPSSVAAPTIPSGGAAPQSSAATQPRSTHSPSSR